MGKTVFMFPGQGAQYIGCLLYTSCAATFMNGIIDLHQIIFTNDINNEIPMTKWY